MARFPNVKNDEWVTPVKRNYKVMCCDCCLIHNIDFRVVGGRVQFRVRRNNRSTAQARRHNNITLKVKYK